MLAWWLNGKESACQCKRCEFWFLGQEDPLEREMATHSCILAAKSHRQRSLVGYSPCGCRVGHNWVTEHAHIITTYFFYNWKVKVVIALCDPMACSPPSSSVHGILQARILVWVAIPFSSNPGIDPRSPTLQADSLPSEPPEKPL